MPDPLSFPSRVTISDDGCERVDKRMVDVAHAVTQRKAEIEALKVQQTKLILTMEEVCFLDLYPIAW